jgi:hypothetical protein
MEADGGVEANYSGSSAEELKLFSSKPQIPPPEFEIAKRFLCEERHPSKKGSDRLDIYQKRTVAKWRPRERVSSRRFISIVVHGIKSTSHSKLTKEI